MRAGSQFCAVMAYRLEAPDLVRICSLHRWWAAQPLWGCRRPSGRGKRRETSWLTPFCRPALLIRCAGQQLFE